METRAHTPLPPLRPDLAGWTIGRARATHLNASLDHDGKRYHLKWHRHGRWRNPARTEWRNAARLARLDVPSVTAIGWGRHRSGTFIVLAHAGGRQANHWWAAQPDRSAARRFCRVLAGWAARLHDANLCHRDLNVYHVLVDGDTLRLIDLGRVLRFSRYRARRWIVKDLAALLDSARREGFPDDLARAFLRDYLRATRRAWRRRRLLAAVARKAARYTRHNRKKEARGEVP